MCDVILGDNKELCDLLAPCCVWNSEDINDMFCTGAFGNEACVVNDINDFQDTVQFCPSFNMDGGALDLCTYLYPCCEVDFYGYC